MEPEKSFFSFAAVAAKVLKTCCNAANDPPPFFGSRSSQHAPPPFHCRYGSLSHWNASVLRLTECPCSSEIVTVRSVKERAGHFSRSPV